MPGNLSQETRLSLTLTAALILVFGSGYRAISGKYLAVGERAPNTADRQHPHIAGLSYRQYSRQGIVARLEADSLTVQPRRLLFFNIKSINESHLVNVRAATYLNAKPAQDAGLLPETTDILATDDSDSRHTRANELGLITKTTADGVYLEIFRAGTLVVVLRAEYAETDMKRGITRLAMARLENPDATRIITSNNMTWDPGAQEFRIPGAYTAYTDVGRASGKKISVDLDFRVSAL
jgi:hypothetical protein